MKTDNYFRVHWICISRFRDYKFLNQSLIPGFGKEFWGSMKGLYCDIRLMHFDKTQIQTTEPGPLRDLEKSTVYGHFTRFRRTDRKVI